MASDHPVFTRVYAVISALGERTGLGALRESVLSSAAGPGRALAEIRRVLRPRGTLHVFEHVRAEPGTWVAKLQRAVRPWWPRLAGGCQVDRRTGTLLEQVMSDLFDMSRTSLMALPPVSPTIVGVSRLRDGIVSQVAPWRQRVI